MPVLYHIKVRKWFEGDERILRRIRGRKRKDENEATKNCIKRNFVTFTLSQILLYWVMKSRKV